MPTHMTNICAKFHQNPSTTYRDIASHEKVLTNNGQTDGQTDNPRTWCSPSTIIGGGMKTVFQQSSLSLLNCSSCRTKKAWDPTTKARYNSVKVTSPNFRSRQKYSSKPNQILVVAKLLKHNADTRKAGLWEVGKTQQICACRSLGYLTVPAKKLNY